MMRNLLGATYTALQNGSSESGETCTLGDIDTFKILGRAGQVTNSMAQRQKVECTQGGLQSQNLFTVALAQVSCDPR